MQTSLLLASLSALVSLVPAQGAPPLEANSCFDASGGPSGNFDWVIASGDTFILDTQRAFIVGGPNGVPITVQEVDDGVVRVRDLVIEPGGELRAQGPNPVRILASRNVFVRGRIDVSGFNGRDVLTVNTGNIPEVGGPGGPGAGRGGIGNPVVTGHSLRGGNGHGPLGAADRGGQGGETGVARASLGKDARRPGGGAGGRFARDQGPGLVAEFGANGSQQSRGAETSLMPSMGGHTRPGAFTDEDATNDFFGEAPILGPGGVLLGRQRGELSRLLAGYGGGAGGNASPLFPNPNWTPASDEKGGGGGGGGGALHVQALGRIVFGATGEIRSNGGRGGLGENVLALDHIGGSGGSGSGGHVVLESATWIDFTDGGANLLAAPRDWLSARGGPRVVGTPTPAAPGASNGGAGGPGVVQLHVPDPSLPPGPSPLQSQIIVPLSDRKSVV